MMQTTPQEKIKTKAEQSKWENRMRKLYPDFTSAKWAKSSYRLSHPQP